MEIQCRWFENEKTPTLMTRLGPAEYQRFGRSGTTSGPKYGPKSGTRRQSTALLAEFKHRSMFRTAMPINPANAPAAA